MAAAASASMMQASTEETVMQGSYAADDFNAIARRLHEIHAEAQWAEEDRVENTRRAHASREPARTPPSGIWQFNTPAHSGRRA